MAIRRPRCIIQVQLIFFINYFSMKALNQVKIYCYRFAARLIGPQRSDFYEMHFLLLLLFLIHVDPSCIVEGTT